MKVALFFECTEVGIQLQCKGYVNRTEMPTAWVPTLFLCMPSERCCLGPSLLSSGRRGGPTHGWGSGGLSRECGSDWSTRKLGRGAGRSHRTDFLKQDLFHLNCLHHHSDLILITTLQSVINAKFSYQKALALPWERTWSRQYWKYAPYASFNSGSLYYVLGLTGISLNPIVVMATLLESHT